MNGSFLEAAVSLPVLPGGIFFGGGNSDVEVETPEKTAGPDRRTASCPAEQVR